MYNMRIIFAGKFIWFLLVGLALFFFLMFSAASRGTELSHSMVYGQLTIPGLLLVFYPACFGIQNDADHRILELLFGIPNYMYKVWLFRLFMIYVEVYLILVVYAFLARILLYPVAPFVMAAQLMIPVMLFGNLAFLYSTLIRNGNAAAVLSVLTVILALILVFGCAACGGQTEEAAPKTESAKQDTVKLTLSEVTHSVFYAPQYVALEKGFFAEEGLEIELINVGGADKVMTSVLTGEAEIGFCGPEACI